MMFATRSGSAARLIYVRAVSPADANVVFLQSLAAAPPIGDRLYRSIDGGLSFSEVLVTTDPITDVVVHDATTVIAATQSGSFRSTDGGATFQPLAIPLACLGQRSDGAMYGCMSSFAGDGGGGVHGDDRCDVPRERPRQAVRSGP
jgi:hypothetical protein